jgi:hypothetical protein
MEAGHIITVEVREFPCAKDYEMGMWHSPIIAGGTFARRVALEILLSQILKCGFVQSILSDLRRIVPLGNGPHMHGCHLARLIHGERSIGPDREVPHPSANALFQDERLPPLGDPERKAWQLRIAYKDLAR